APCDRARAPRPSSPHSQGVRHGFGLVCVPATGWPAPPPVPGDLHLRPDARRWSPPRTVGPRLSRAATMGLPASRSQALPAACPLTPFGPAPAGLTPVAIRVGRALPAPALSIYRAGSSCAPADLAGWLWPSSSYARG